MATRRALLRTTPWLAALSGAGLAGCVAYPDYYGTPTMVWLPSPGVYVAYNYNYPLFYFGSSYYYTAAGHWYTGQYYRGPWHPIPGPPPPLRGFQSGYWPSYQSRAGTYYRANPGWRHFQPHR
jgi:hypothetical protein